MSYEQFITEVQKYWDLRQKGLKKQANKFLFAFTNHFKENFLGIICLGAIYHFN